jgi:hypothetical protein
VGRLNLAIVAVRGNKTLWNAGDAVGLGSRVSGDIWRDSEFDIAMVCGVCRVVYFVWPSERCCCCWCCAHCSLGGGGVRVSGDGGYKPPERTCLSGGGNRSVITGGHRRGCVVVVCAI